MRGYRDWGRRGTACRGGSRNNFCRNFQTGQCPLAQTANFPTNEWRRPPKQQKARADYNARKRLTKTPPKPNDIWTIQRLWSGALVILDEEDRDWKQMPPCDLDDEYYGRNHIHTLLSMWPIPMVVASLWVSATPSSWLEHIQHCWTACQLTRSWEIGTTTSMAATGLEQPLSSSA